MSSVTLLEMGPRDGLQVLNGKRSISIEDRKELLRTLHHAGFLYIEAGAFVSATQVPAMADTAELLNSMQTLDRLAALVVNERHYKRLQEVRDLKKVAVFVAADEHYNMLNACMSLKQAIAETKRVVDVARADRRHINAHLSYSFRRYDGSEMPAEVIVGLCRDLLEMGCHMVVLADNDGRSSKKDIARVLSHLRSEFAEEFQTRRIGVHLRNRRNQGLHNAMAAYEGGVRCFGTAIGGIGRSMVVRGGEVGNIPTEELLVHLASNGIETNLDLETVMEAGEIVYHMTQTANVPPPPSSVLQEYLEKRSRQEGDS